MDTNAILARAVALFPADGKPPKFHDRWGDFARYGAWLQCERERTYPELIAKGAMTTEASERAMLAIRSLAAMWADAAACRMPAARTDGWDYPADRWAMIETILKPFAKLDRRRAAAPREQPTRDRHACLLAMIWWLMRSPRGPIGVVEATLQFRAAEVASLRKEAA